MRHPAGRSGDDGPETSKTIDEQAPLLSNERLAVDADEPEPECEPEDQGKDSDARRVLMRRVVVMAGVLMFIISLAGGLSVPPMTAAMEGILCRQMHPEVAHGIPPIRGVLDVFKDRVCKENDVQRYLALLRGWGATFDCVPGLLTAIPWGIVSDRWGRQPVLVLGVLGLNLSIVWVYFIFYFFDVFPLWAVWFSSFFLLIGGSGTVLLAMIYTILADVVPVAGRATVFFQLTALYLSGQMLGGPLAGTLMRYNLWISLSLALGLLMLSNVIAMWLPETVGVHDGRGRAGYEELERVTIESDDSSSTAGPDTDDAEPSLAHGIRQKTRDSLVKVWGFVLGNRGTTFLMVSLVFVILGRFVQEVLMQYATKRYEWDYAQAAFILTILSATSLATLLALLPAASWLSISYFNMYSLSKDIWLARISGIVQIVGCLIIAMAGNGHVLSVGLVWFGLGSGLPSLIRSLVNSLVEEHHIGIANTLVGFMETMGVMIAGPILAESLTLGSNLGGVWVGLPFFVAALLFSVSTLIVWLFRLPAGLARRPSSSLSEA
ncbi:major facilitator superfamily domain-containing protein [Cercophora scortea]|uniref:Major facilitator superfamily domain-containing protein n=1 Tax=Cercophora scortea TaxID=314031 RepID=A0AAE0J3X4_9PEZI|nr:major facilitator superfamily domain-containing protein [Cercophora scortea]